MLKYEEEGLVGLHVAPATWQKSGGRQLHAWIGGERPGLRRAPGDAPRRAWRARDARGGARAKACRRSPREPPARIAPQVPNPAVDYVPPELVSLFLTNIGPHHASYIYRLLAEYYHQEDYHVFE